MTAGLAESRCPSRFSDARSSSSARLRSLVSRTSRLHVPSEKMLNAKMEDASRNDFGDFPITGSQRPLYILVEYLKGECYCEQEKSGNRRYDEGAEFPSAPTPLVRHVATLPS